MVTLAGFLSFDESFLILELLEHLACRHGNSELMLLLETHNYLLFLSHLHDRDKCLEFLFNRFVFSTGRDNLSLLRCHKRLARNFKLAIASNNVGEWGSLLLLLFHDLN